MLSTSDVLLRILETARFLVQDAGRRPGCDWAEGRAQQPTAPSRRRRMGGERVWGLGRAAAAARLAPNCARRLQTCTLHKEAPVAERPSAQPQRLRDTVPEQACGESSYLSRIPRQSESAAANASASAKPHANAAQQLEGASRAAARLAIRWVEYWRLMTVKDGVSFPPALANQPHPKHRS